MTPTWEDGPVRLYNADCRDVLAGMTLPASTLVVMDPPYGIQHSSSFGATWQDTTIANDHSTELRDWLIGWLAHFPMVVFGTWKAPRPANARAVLIWDKGPAFGMGDLSFPWKNSFEEIYVLGGGWRGKRDEGVLRGPPVVSWESRGRRHPHEKPLWLMTHFIRKMPAGLVVDPCMGAGVAGVAAIQAGRSFLGIELDPAHYATAQRRITAALHDQRTGLFPPPEVVTPAELFRE